MRAAAIRRGGAIRTFDPTAHVASNWDIWNEITFPRITVIETKPLAGSASSISDMTIRLDWSDLPGDLIERLGPWRELLLSDIPLLSGYLDAILRYAQRGIIEWGWENPIGETAMREECLSVAQASFDVCFALMSDGMAMTGVVDGMESELWKALALLVFWDGQTGSAIGPELAFGSIRDRWSWWSEDDELAEKSQVIADFAEWARDNIGLDLDLEHEDWGPGWKHEPQSGNL